jgi:hypothetical protein
MFDLPMLDHCRLQPRDGRVMHEVTGASRWACAAVAAGEEMIVARNIMLAK